jgi:hypothetical protein
VDIGYVHLALGYQVYRAYDAQYAIPYYTILGISLFSFPIGVYLHIKKTNLWTSTYLHGCVHIFGNVSNFVLYSGYVKKLI